MKCSALSQQHLNEVSYSHFNESLFALPNFKVKCTPNPLPKPKYEKLREKYTETPDFRIFFSYFFVVWFGEGIRGVFWGSEGFCILYGVQESAMLVLGDIRDYMGLGIT